MKVGRNQPCPCGSGKKYKHCHGATVDPKSPAGSLGLLASRMEALQRQREVQQGLGRPIVSTVHKGFRFVAVGSRIHYSRNWKTFHDFLFDYLMLSMGTAWFHAEVLKASTKSHPLVRWRQVVDQHRRGPGRREAIFSSPMVGTVAAYLALAYNLYLIAHNSRVEALLVKRLRDPLQFAPAYYETYVAAAFIKAGFQITPEDESDSTTSHSEFVATFPETGKKFSVEAKHRRFGKQDGSVANQLYEALRKTLTHERIIFIDLNVAAAKQADAAQAALREALDSIRSKEPVLTVDRAPAPSAYVVVTNQYHADNPEATNLACEAFAEGFKIPDFRYDAKFHTLREALEARNKHFEMFRLMESLRTHYEIPSTFDGEIPELFFDRTTPRLLIGHRYLIPLADGTETEGLLLDATVLLPEKKAYGVYRIPTGKTVIVASDLSDAEIQAYRRHPDTFFGVLRKQGSTPRDALDWYDFFYDTYKHSTMEKLLEFMKDHSDIDGLRSKTQEELASIYCESLVYSVMSSKDGQQA